MSIYSLLHLIKRNNDLLVKDVDEDEDDYDCYYDDDLLIQIKHPNVTDFIQLQ